jgi:protein-export membrane protein SecD
MLFIYRTFGLFADIALIINLLLVLGVLSMFQATLTLPGIAGIILTIGMAVDANVLIFERVKEELRNGSSMINSIDNGYKRALSTILDANITTLIACNNIIFYGFWPCKRIFYYSCNWYFYICLYSIYSYKIFYFTESKKNEIRKCRA